MPWLKSHERSAIRLCTRPRSSKLPVFTISADTANSCEENKHKK